MTPRATHAVRALYLRSKADLETAQARLSLERSLHELTKNALLEISDSLSEPESLTHYPVLLEVRQSFRKVLIDREQGLLLALVHQQRELERVDQEHREARDRFERLRTAYARLGGTVH